MIIIDIGQDIFEAFTNDKNNSKQDVVTLSQMAIDKIRSKPNKVAEDIKESLYEYCSLNQLCKYCGGNVVYDYRLHSLVCTECGAYNNKIYE